MMNIVYLDGEYINLKELNLEYYLENGYCLEFVGVIDNHWIYELIKIK